MSLDGPNEHGFLRRRDLRRRGVSDKEIARQLRSGEWVPLIRGRYAPAAEPPAAGSDPVVAEHVARSAQFALRSRAAAEAVASAVASHHSAAVLHGLPVPTRELGLVRLTRPGRGGNRRTRHSVVHAAALDESEIVDLDGIRVTSVARTIADLARICRFEDAVAVADAALREGRIDAAGMLDQYRRSRRGGPGADSIRHVLVFADGRSESVGESHTRVALRRAGLASPDLQVLVHDAEGHFLGRGDLGYEECALLCEFDGMSKYRLDGQDPADSLRREKVREDGLRAGGLLVARIVWGDLGSPERLRRRLDVMRERGRELRRRGMVSASWSPRPRIGLEL